MSESTLRRRCIRALLEAGGMAVAVENPLLSGLPDVSWTLQGDGGWLELKILDALPVRARSVVRIDHFTTDQLRFLVEWWVAGGSALLGVRFPQGEMLLFGAKGAVMVKSGITTQRMREIALWRGSVREIPGGLLAASKLARDAWYDFLENMK